MSIVFVFKDIFMGMKKEMVPMARLELARLAPPPPQDGVSTKFHHIGFKILTINGSSYKCRALEA